MPPTRDGEFSSDPRCRPQRVAGAGYDATSLRGIARTAGVDSALVVHYFGSKDRLFAAVMRLPGGLPEQVLGLAEQGVTGLGERLTRFFLSLWEDPDAKEPMLALVRSAVSNEQAAATLRGVRHRRSADAPRRDPRGFRTHGCEPRLPGRS